MFENILKFFKRTNKKEASNTKSRETAKERLHLVLMQDRANVSADFLDLMRQEIIEVIKKYIDIDESSMDVRLTNQANDDGTQGAPALYANIPILNIKEKSKNAKKELAKNEEKNLEQKSEKETEQNIAQNNEKENKKNEQVEKNKDNKEEKIDAEKTAEDKIEEAKKIEEQALSSVSQEKTKKESENE